MEATIKYVETPNMLLDESNKYNKQNNWNNQLVLWCKLVYSIILVKMCKCVNDYDTGLIPFTYFTDGKTQINQIYNPTL